MIIFLDIDGVLVTHREVRGNTFNSRCVKNINKLCDLYENTKIVVTSMWRLGKSLDQLKELLTSQGITSEVIGKTEDHFGDGSQDMPRGKEILEWLNNNNYTGPYLVVDDEIGDILEHIPTENILWVEDGLFRRGFTEERLRDWKKKTLKYLKKKV